MASANQILDFVKENDSSKNRRVTRLMQEYLEKLGTDRSSTIGLSQSSELIALRPFYRACLSRNFHEFRTTLFGFKCYCVTNAVPGEIAGVCLFYHGLGASPNAFLRIFDNFYAHYGASVPVAFVLPQAPLPMHPDEIGADGTCSFGSFKWWDVMDPSWKTTQWFGKKIKGENGEEVSNSAYPSVNEVNTGNYTDLATEYNMNRKCRADEPSGLLKLRPLLDGLRREICKVFKIPPQRLAVSGFSQGAMLACDTFYSSQTAPLALGVFSGAPLSLDHWEKRVKSWKKDGKWDEFTGIPIIQTHGTTDSVIPLTAGRFLTKVFREHGMHHRMAIFPGNHFLPDTVINLFGSVLIARLRDLSLRGWYNLPLKMRMDQHEQDVTADIHKILGPAPEVVNLIQIEDDAEFLGYFEKQPMRHFFNGNEHNKTPEIAHIPSPALQRLKVRRRKRRNRLEAEFGQADSDERLCETSDSLRSRSDDIPFDDDIKGERRWTCVSRTGKGQKTDDSMREDSEDMDHLVRLKVDNRRRLKVLKKSYDAQDDKLTFGNKSGYKLSYGFLQCCLPVASHCLE